jgi:sigma-54 dependent transcriptional regulator, flagellar regulatory protein
MVALLIQRMTGQENRALCQQVLQCFMARIHRDYGWPGNVRELEQAVRRVLLNGSYLPQPSDLARADDWLRQIEQGALSAQQLMAGYCYRLYQRIGTYDEVARTTGLDRRTAKKYIDQGWKPTQPHTP